MDINNRSFVLALKLHKYKINYCYIHIVFNWLDVLNYICCLLRVDIKIWKYIYNVESPCGEDLREVKRGIRSVSNSNFLKTRNCRVWRLSHNPLLNGGLCLTADINRSMDGNKTSIKQIRSHYSFNRCTGGVLVKIAIYSAKFVVRFARDNAMYKPQIV